jgi:hypothetical protein
MVVVGTMEKKKFSTIGMACALRPPFAHVQIIFVTNDDSIRYWTLT